MAVMNKGINLTNIPSLSVGNIVEQLSEAYVNVINKGLPVKTMPSGMLWGPPGSGKSQAVRQIANVIAKKTNKKTNVTDVRLLLFNPIDLRGIPTANADKTLAIWLKPKIFQMDDSSDVANILFLDEISAAPQSVQAAAYQITLDRVVGEHKLPDNCIVMAAGNRTTDKSVAFKMPKALANRLLHLEVEISFESWKKWAVSTNIHQWVVGYLSYRSGSLMNFDASTEELAFATPRSWEMVSNVLNVMGKDFDSSFMLVAGLVGIGIASDFKAWLNVYKDLPDIEDIFNGKTQKVPTRPDALYALISEMVVYARKHSEDMEKIRNSIIYAGRIPPDFSVILLKDYLRIEPEYDRKLMKIPEFSTWMRNKGSLLNGNL